MPPLPTSAPSATQGPCTDPKSISNSPSHGSPHLLAPTHPIAAPRIEERDALKPLEAAQAQEWEIPALVPGWRSMEVKGRGSLPAGWCWLY